MSHIRASLDCCLSHLLVLVGASFATWRYEKHKLIFNWLLVKLELLRAFKLFRALAFGQHSDLDHNKGSVFWVWISAVQPSVHGVMGGHLSLMQTDAKLSANNTQYCRIQHVAPVCMACWHLWWFVGHCLRLKLVKLSAQQVLIFLLFCYWQSVTVAFFAQLDLVKTTRC